MAQLTNQTTIKISELSKTSSTLVDLSSEMKENIEKLQEADNVLSAATEDNRNKIENLEKENEFLKNENYHLKDTIESLMKLTISVPYESGYLRAIGATRNVKLYDWLQENLNNLKN